MTRRKRDARAEALVAQRPPADAVAYMPPPGRLSLTRPLHEALDPKRPGGVGDRNQRSGEVLTPH